MSFQEYDLPEMIEEWVWSSVENVEKSELDNFYVQMASSGYESPPKIHSSIILATTGAKKATASARLTTQIL